MAFAYVGNVTLKSTTELGILLRRKGVKFGALPFEWPALSGCSTKVYPASNASFKKSAFFPMSRVVLPGNTHGDGYMAMGQY